MIIKGLSSDTHSGSLIYFPLNDVMIVIHSCNLYMVGQLRANEENLCVRWSGISRERREAAAAMEGGNNLSYVCVLSIPSSPG